VITVEENVYVALSWVAPESNHLELTQLQVQVQNALSFDFSDVCEDQWFTCRILMTELRDNFGYQLQQMPIFRARARN
jgi:hypothetical protein